MTFTKYFLFYDYETFGLDTALDKIAQFSCIRTDLNFELIEKQKVLYCTPPIDYLPNPESVLVTGITPQITISKKGYIEHIFAKKIFNIFKKSNTCILGYNNISFDDEMTRNLFYRNFFDPYEWSWKNNNSRWDIINVLRAVFVLRPDGINWPKNKVGNFVFNLDRVTKKNKIFHLNAHDALSDVNACIELMKLLKKKKKKLLDFLFFYKTKKNILSLISNTKINLFVYISSIFGIERNFVSLISIFFFHPENKNVLVFFDLSKKISTLLNFFKNIEMDKWTLDDFFSLGINFLHINRCPVLVPRSVLRNVDFCRLKINKEKYYSNFKNLSKNIYFLRQKILNFFLKRKSSFNEKNFKNKKFNIDLSLYDSFLSYSEKNAMNVIQSMSNFLELKKLKFKSKRINNLLLNFKGRNYPKSLTKNEKLVWENQCKAFINPIVLFEYRKKIFSLLQKYRKDDRICLLLNDLLEYMNFIKKKIYLN
ncbi:MAG TPA: exodeoxyribonuclease I [Buchnera sp. (in: enterobacteria)]|nr:exodeoxyribonuclease I [Buchnera sp. (in: enterobacteria)]